MYDFEILASSACQSSAVLKVIPVAISLSSFIQGTKNQFRGCGSSILDQSIIVSARSHNLRKFPCDLSSICPGDIDADSVVDEADMSKELHEKFGVDLGSGSGYVFTTEEWATIGKQFTDEWDGGKTEEAIKSHVNFAKLWGRRWRRFRIDEKGSIVGDGGLDTFKAAMKEEFSDIFGTHI